MKSITINDEITLGEMHEAIKEAYKEGWESDDSLFLALNVDNQKEVLK